MATIVEEMSKVSLERGTKRVEVWHMKAAIERTEMLDFLKEIVEPIQDPYADGRDESAVLKGRKKREPKKLLSERLEKQKQDQEQE